MSKVRSVISAIVPLAVVAGFMLVSRGLQKFDEMPYRGKTYKLGKHYSSWEDFKSDPTIAKEQLKAVQKAVESDPLTPVYMSRWDLIKGNGDIEFPGFGMSTFGEHAAPDGSILAGNSFEIPLADKDRIVVYRGRDDTWTLIDDFVWTPSQAIWRVDEKDGSLVYSDFDGKMVVTREMRR